MSLPSANANVNANPNPNPNATGQSSIRSFFRPKQPTYAPPPSSTTSYQTKEPLPPPSTRPTPSSKPALPVTTAATTLPSASSPPPIRSISSSSPRSSHLHSQATIARIQADHIPALRRITSLLLPVNYPDSFYARLQDPLSSGAFSRVVLWRDDDNPSSPPKVVGGIVCRPEPSQFPPRAGPTAPQPNALYIQSLVLLSPYRSLGLAAALLDAVVQDAKKSHFACETAWAHVWSPNEEGLRWYTARGFHKVEEVKGYYFKLRPDSAWIVRRDMGSVAQGPAPPATAVTDSIPGSVTAAAANLPSPSLKAPPYRCARPPSPDPPLKNNSSSSSSSRTNNNTNNNHTSTGRSYQKVGPATEWNDLPPDMAPLSMISSTTKNGSGDNNCLQLPRSNTSSRSSSAARSKKKDRAYPAAAFGN
ncbi:acyl-CoA N-acyltransferase [Xylariaceae sp. FL1272]|nr:acyl-CoA N-acyltransferase [Xylariaceae sp. FL1272]